MLDKLVSAWASMLSLQAQKPRVSRPLYRKGAVMSDVTERLNCWAGEIDNDGTPSQAGPSADDLREVSAEIASLRAQLAKLEAEKEAGQFWRGVFDSITDKTDREKIEAELSDYNFVMQQVPYVYMHITGGKMSKCNYYASTVIAEADEYSEKFTNEAADEARRKAIEECAAIADRWTSPEQRLHGHGGAGAEILALLSESKT